MECDQWVTCEITKLTRLNISSLSVSVKFLGITRPFNALLKSCNYQYSELSLLAFFIG